MIVTDLDGTLLRSDGMVSTRTCEAIRAAESAGIAVVIATARPPRDIASLAERIGVRGAAVCSNGAILYDLDERRRIDCVGLDPAYVGDLIAALRAADRDLALAIESDESIVGDQAFPAFRQDITIWRSGLERMPSSDLIKVLVHHPRHTPEALMAAVAELVGSSAEVIHSGGPQFVEIAAVGTSKAMGLERICTRQQVLPSEVVAFGDMPNDLHMLRFAGRSVAVSNAHPDILSSVDEITRSNDHDGVALVIEKLLAWPHMFCAEGPENVNAASMARS